MGTLDSNLDIQEGDFSSDDEVVAEDVVNDENDDEANVKIAKADESHDDVARRKKIRRLLDLQLERRRLRKEIDFYSDLEDDDYVDDEDENS